MNLNQRYSAAASDHATLQYLRRIENGEIMGRSNSIQFSSVGLAQARSTPTSGFH